MEKIGIDMDSKEVGVKYYEYGMKLLKQYKYDRANAYFRVAYDLLQEHKSVECYPDLCYRIYCGMSPFSSTLVTLKDLMPSSFSTLLMPFSTREIIWLRCSAFSSSVPE